MMSDFPKTLLWYLEYESLTTKKKKIQQQINDSYI